MKSQIKRAPNFAEKFSQILQDHNKTQRQVAKNFNVSTSAINRLCKDGIGSENHICDILLAFKFKRRRIIELLTDRRSEISDGSAKEIWKNFRYAFLDEDEYLKEICPFPLERAYSCTHLGIHIPDVIELAKQCGIQHISQTSEINFNKILGLMTVFEETYGIEARKVVFNQKCKCFPPVLLMDFKEQVSVSDYHIKLDKCDGKLLFGLPHLVIGDYNFDKGGSIGPHRNTGGIEFLCSLSGTFELTCSNITYAAKLTPGRTLYILDARKRHAIKLIEGESGRLLMARFYPKRREVTAGKPKRKARNKKT